MEAALHRFEASPTNKLYPALASLLMHGLLVLVLYYGVSWQSRPAEAISAELVQSLPPLPAAQMKSPAPPREEPRVEPKPEPKPEPKTVKEPDIEKPDIAIKKTEPKKVEKKEPAKKEPLEKPKDPPKSKPEPTKPEPKPTPKDNKTSADDSRLDKLMNQDIQRVHQAKQMNKLDQELSRVAGVRAEGERKATAQALGNAQGEWVHQIQMKVRSKMALPPGISGKPKAEFELELLPDGSLAREPRLVKSSGIPALDEASKRAILKSEPLPLPSKREVFQRSLKFVFDPLGE